jgi:very-short-patch-repair endonuclease
MSKEIEIVTANKIKEHYSCRIIIDEITEPYTLYCARDIADILGISNIRDNLSNNYNKYKKFINTNRGLQNITFIKYNDLIRLIVKSRKPNVIDFCKKIGLEVNTKVYSCIESDTIKCINDAFNGEEMLLQYKVDKYMIDLYFPKYKLAIECDEENHKKPLYIKNDLIRENEIKTQITGCVFMRYDPYSQDFNIFYIINQIYKHIKLYK